LSDIVCGKRRKGKYDRDERERENFEKAKKIKD
jgi:hypothetical protein